VEDRTPALACACCEQPQSGGAVRLWPETNLHVCYSCLDWMNSQRERQVRQGADQVRLLGYEPIFAVADVARAAAHYELLGFRSEMHDATYAFATLGQLTLHLARHGGHGWPGYRPQGHMTSVLYLHIDDADRLAGQWRQAGMTVHGPADTEYGKREGQHVDPDGNLLRFGSPLSG
jgi:uncharacterized glyoxalase superfamily protein PhnB